MQDVANDASRNKVSTGDDGKYSPLPHPLPKAPAPREEAFEQNIWMPSWLKGGGDLHRTMFKSFNTQGVSWVVVVVGGGGGVGGKC